MVNYVLHNENCLDALKKMDDHSIDAMVTDPPFALAGGISNGRSSIVSTQFFSFWWNAVCEELNRVLKPDGEGFLWCDWRTAHIFADGFSQHQKYTWRLAQMLYHYREMPGQGQPFRSSVDMIAYIRGPKSKPTRIPNTTHNLISKYWYYGKHPHHPAEKSVEVSRGLLEWCSDKGQTVIDPFMGSASVGVACITSERNYIGIEMQQDHFEVAEKRLEKIEIGYNVERKIFKSNVQLEMFDFG